jgi:hypothetical protein
MKMGLPHWAQAFEKRNWANLRGVSVRNSIRHTPAISSPPDPSASVAKLKKK